ncbi:DUF4097 domain-containing protein [Pontibacter sp. E15-1]|uniref:DUF4097 domain-containing protein n=1 Tax=Pontibacter sp. E15-1 TaxID=2919918 RepID=UPI001F5005C2|nr:DUF4097 domain-containing protein [Pontibacter sp. E15-1]MCJ8167523.1 DUF4097 domain-containing protein [Pontibacter sp. E15-1]
MIPHVYNSLRRLLLLTIVSALVLTPALAQTPCPVASPVPMEAPHLEELALLIQQTVPQPQPAPKPLPAPHPQVAEQPDVVTAVYDVEKRKFVDKTFKVSRADMLNIENRFGKVHINTWDKNEMHVRVDIIARAGTDSRAQEILNSIRVMESREGGTVSFRTDIEPMRFSGSGSRSFEVNYTISMPEENPLTVKNSFGDVYLAAFKGKADISVKHGSLKCERLGNTGNTVKLAYGSGSCGYINGGSIDVAYADMNVGGATGFHGSSKFSDFKVGSLSETMEMDVKYGSFKVDNISRNIRKIALDSGFTPISLSFDANTAFNFDVSVQFADFKYDKSQVNITSLEKSHTSAAYKGEYGGSSPKGLVSINSKYGEVRFTK